MTNINCIFPGTLVPRCNDNCCFITLCGALLHAILRSNIWWKNSLYSGLQRFKEAGSEKVPDPLVGLASSFLPKYSMIWPERALVHRNQAYTRLKCTQHSPRLTSRHSRQTCWFPQGRKGLQSLVGSEQTCLPRSLDSVLQIYRWLDTSQWHVRSLCMCRHHSWWGRTHWT